MPRIPTLPLPQAPIESQAVYEEFYRRMSFPSPPNFILTQGHSPTVARGTWELVRNVLVSGEIPRWIKEMMFVAISNDRQCRYCAAAHLACCRLLGTKPEFLNDLVANVESIADLQVRDLVLFALKCARNPQGLEAADFDTLRKHGLKESAILEVIAMSALAVYATILADATQMQEDEMFSTL